MKNIKLKAGLTALFLASLTVACNKSTDELTSSTTDDSVEAKVGGVASAVMPHHHKGELLLPLFDACEAPSDFADKMSIEISGDDYPKTITITPKESPEHCEDCTMETVITLSDDMKNAGAVQTVETTFSGDKGTRTSSVTITNEGNKTGNFIYSIVAESAASGDKGEMMGTASGTAEMIAGYDSDSCDDDVFVLNGSSERSGDLGTMTSTTTDLTVSKACQYPVSGVVTHEGDLGSRSIDFGDGTCDALAEVTDEDGETTEIDLSARPDHKRGGHKGQRGGDCSSDQ